MEQLQKILTDLGFKMTKQRRVILDVLNQSTQHVTAEQIYDLVKAKEKTVSYATVYRTLELLVRLKLVHQLHLGGNRSRFQLVRSDHSHHLVCLGCGQKTEIENCPLAHLTQLDQNGGEFSVVDHRFEVFGYCIRCKE